MKFYWNFPVKSQVLGMSILDKLGVLYIRSMYPCLQQVAPAGIAHTDWSRITSNLGISYHTKDSATAVRYLGYPLYSAPHQLQAYLGKIRALILGHCTKLAGRDLSVQGLTSVANSVILSKLWHLLRVIPEPLKWLDEIRSIVRKLVLSFWPAPSWGSICLPKSKGGLRVIDLHTQHHALQLLYIQRIIRDKNSNDFVTPWIGYCVYLYTGHHSYLPWLQYPAQYQPHFKRLPTMNILTTMLTKLPALPNHPKWSGRWYADVPLRCALSPPPLIGITGAITDPVGPAYPISSLSLRHLVSDLLPTVLLTGLTTNSLTFIDYCRIIIQELYGNLSLPSSCRLKCFSLIKDYPAIRYPFMPRFVPSCVHWMLSPSGGSPVPISKLTPKDYR